MPRNDELVRAANAGDLGKVKQLIEAGADPNSVDKHQGLDQTSFPKIGTVLEVTTMHCPLLIFGLLTAALLATSESAFGQKHDRNSYLGKSPPELVSESHHWIGASAPLTLAKLKGKVVWLHFNF